MSKVTLPTFVVDEARAVIGPLALWAPREMGSVHRWSGVDTTAPSVRLAVLTCATPSRFAVRAARRTVREDFEWIAGGPLPRTAGAGVEDHWRVDAWSEAPAWIARRAHPGVTLAQLLAADRRGDPPGELLAAVVRALTSGARSCTRIMMPHDVVVGVDGVISADGFDLRRPALWFPDFTPDIFGDVPAFDIEWCRRVIRHILADLDREKIDKLIRHVNTTGDDEAARERALIADIVAGLMPAVRRVEDETAEELALLGAATWAAWATPEGQERAIGKAPLAGARGASPITRSAHRILSDVDVRFVGQTRPALSRFVGSDAPAFDLVVGNFDDLASAVRTRERADVAIVIGPGPLPAAMPTIRVASRAEARRASMIVCSIVDALLHGYVHIEADDVRRLLAEGEVELTTYRIFALSLTEAVDELAARLRARPGLRGAALCFVASPDLTLHEINVSLAHLEELLSEDVEILFGWRSRNSRLCIEAVAVYSCAANH
jgi:hypothetical protein